MIYFYIYIKYYLHTLCILHTYHIHPVIYRYIYIYIDAHIYIYTSTSTCIHLFSPVPARPAARCWWWRRIPSVAAVPLGSCVEWRFSWEIPQLPLKNGNLIGFDRILRPQWGFQHQEWGLICEKQNLNKLKKTWGIKH